MNIFGLEISRTKRLPVGSTSVDSGRNGWFPIIRESYSGSFQENVEVTLETVLTHPIVYACLSLISNDVAKLGDPLLYTVDADGIWTETESPAFSQFLKQPNRYQNSIQFYQQWIVCLLSWGNTYVLRARDARQVTVAGYILDPQRVRPLVAPDGSVYYELKTDNLTGIQQDIVVPQSEIMHDRMPALYHPLVGTAPVVACGLAATMGVRILTNSANLFANGANPGGVLTAPGHISQETADRVKAKWESEYGGDNVGKIAVLGDNLKFERMAMTSVDTQTTEQVDAVSKLICSAFLVPAYKAGVGPVPMSNNVEALTQEYYQQALQIRFESIEKLLDKELPKPYRVAFDTDTLLRMDTATLMKAISDGIGAGVMKPNEGRLRLNLKPVEGGDTPYLQQQNFSLSALNKRDAKADPFTAASASAQAAPVVEPELEDETPKYIAAFVEKMAEDLHAA